MKAIILAGGQGTRLHPYTKILPKCMIPLDGIPILQILLLQLRDAGFSQVILSVYHLASLIERYFGNGDWLDMELTYSREPEPLGTAGPLSLIESFDTPTLVLNADLLTTINFMDVFIAHTCSAAMGTVVICQHTVPMELGVVELDCHQRITRYEEKPKLNFLVGGGIYVLDPSVLDYIPKQKYMDMPVLIQKLLANNHIINSYFSQERWLDIGTIEQYQYADEVFRRHRESFLKYEYAPSAPDANL